MPNSNLRSKCKNLIASCHKSYLDNMQSNIKRNVKLFWAYTKNRKQTNTYPSEFNYQNQTSQDPKRICEMFSNYFQSTYATKNLNQSLNVTSPFVNSNIENPITISQGNVEKILSTLDENKNGGPDHIPNVFLKTLSALLAKPLSMIFNQ